MFVVGGVHDNVAEPVATACTVMLKAASDVLVSPSLTLMTMPLVVPTCCAAGAPDSRPVAVSKDAQTGGFAMLNVNGSASGSLAVGAKTYCVPGVIAVFGAPLIVGARFAASLTTIENGASCALS